MRAAQKQIKIFVLLTRGDHTYLIVYDSQRSLTQIGGCLSRWVVNPDLPFGFRECYLMMRQAWRIRYGWQRD